MANPGQAPHGEIVIYQMDDSQTRIDVRMVDETVWLSLDQMAELFQRDKSTISRHLSNVFNEGELARERVVADFATTAGASGHLSLTQHLPAIMWRFKYTYRGYVCAKSSE